MKMLRPFLTMLLFSTVSALMPSSAQTTVLTEDFSGSTNIFGITSTDLAVGTAAIYDTGLTGFGPVLAVCKTTAEGIFSSANGDPIAVTDGTTVTAEWDAFHGYFGNSRSTTVSLLNSDGNVVASYDYNTKECKVTKVTIGGQDVVGFEPFGMQVQNGFGGNGKPYTATGNPHIAITITARGGVTMVFSKGTTEVKTVLGSLGELKKDIAKMRIVSTVDNTDRCYAIDNIKVTTDMMEDDPNYVESIASAVIAGEQRMTFGPSPDEAFKNLYTVNIVGSDGTLISEETISEKVTDFKVTWDIEGFKTQNDTEGQYCDSYGAFSTNNEGKVNTSFDLRDVPMNFFGKMTATITYNGTTTVAEKYVVAQGDLSKSATQVLPLAGYPANFSSYPDALVGYQLTKETYGGAADVLMGGWCVAGSDSHKASLLADADGTKFVQVTAANIKKSHVITKTIDSPTGQIIFVSRLRFNQAGATMSLTGGYPFWSASRYTCPVSLSFDGNSLTLNGTALTLDDAQAAFTIGTWYDIVLSADKSSEHCYAFVYDKDGKLLGQTSIQAWAETSSPTYFNIGMGNSNTGSVDLASYSAYTPTADADHYVLTADKTTLSIPQGEQARLTATITDTYGRPITQQALWTVVEEDMRQSVIITLDANDSHTATVSLAPTAEAGTATIQVSIGGSVRTLPLSLTTSAESIKFTQSTTSITIPMDDDKTTTAQFAATVIDGEGNDLHSPVALSLYNKDNTQPFSGSEGISFDTSTGILSITAKAAPIVLTVRATANNSKGESLSKIIRVNIHGMKFDFGYADDEALAEGFTQVGAQTTYSDANGYGLVSGTPTAGGTASATDATTDYLEGDLQFDFKVQKGCYYSVEITYQGKLTTGYVNSDLAGYELGTHESLTTETYTLPATLDVADLHLAPADATSVARLAQVVVTKQPARQKRGKRRVHHIGDSTSANNGSWAYRLKNLVAGGTYPELSELCDFQNKGAGGRNLSTYYTQGKLAGVLLDIYPDDVVMFGNNGTNGMGNSFEADMNYYLDAAETLGAKIIINSYTPHGAVGSYANGYNAQTGTFDSYRRDGYETVVRRVAEERATSDSNYLGFVEIGKNADAIFNAYVADYAANAYATADAAAQAIIECFTDHNHYSNGTLACTLMLDGYKSVATPGIVQQIISLLNHQQTLTAITTLPSNAPQSQEVYNLNGQRVMPAARTGLHGLYIVGGKKVLFK